MPPTNVIPPDWMQYGAFGLISVIVLYTLFWVGPRVIGAVQSIAPTIVKYLQEQEDRHSAWMKDVENRHASERAEFRAMIADLIADREKSGSRP